MGSPTSVSSAPLRVRPASASCHQRGAIGVHARREQHRGRLERVLTHLGRIRQQRQRVQVRHEVEGLAEVLVGDVVTQRTDEVAQVRVARGLDAGQDSHWPIVSVKPASDAIRHAGRRPNRGERAREPGGSMHIGMKIGLAALGGVAAGTVIGMLDGDPNPATGAALTGAGVATTSVFALSARRAGPFSSPTFGLVGVGMGALWAGLGVSTLLRSGTEQPAKVPWNPA